MTRRKALLTGALLAAIVALAWIGDGEGFRVGLLLAGLVGVSDWTSKAAPPEHQERAFTAVLGVSVLVLFVAALIIRMQS